MTPEELMRLRVKVENKWPNCPYEVGDILIKDGDYYWVIGDIGWCGRIPKEDVEPYPYLMRTLAWWEDRKPEDMLGQYIIDKNQRVHKINGHQPDDGAGYAYFTTDEDSLGFYYYIVTPNIITEEEYNNYINKNEIQNL